MSLAVGIDVGAYKCAVAVCHQGDREAERKAITIAANRTGFGELDAWMVTRAEPIDVVVMESSGHYWFNLASHLRRQGYPVAVVNPLQAKYFAKGRLQRSKSDPADARTLAALGTHDRPRITEPLVGAELKEAARFAMRIVREQAQVCQRIQRLVDIGFPELREVWDDPTCVSALAVLRHAPTCDGGAHAAGPSGSAPAPGHGWPRGWPEEGGSAQAVGQGLGGSAGARGPSAVRDEFAGGPARPPGSLGR
jgi:transposase